jgi:hypothetical protein
MDIPGVEIWPNGGVGSRTVGFVDVPPVVVEADAVQIQPIPPSQDPEGQISGDELAGI